MYIKIVLKDTYILVIAKVVPFFSDVRFYIEIFEIFSVMPPCKLPFCFRTL
ncbi:hypothetical protein C8D94_102133 [Marinirhabdus gelatinilytica]|uniref:Uncharacterized protein n=1 Tax=Marinirhabdus gelatinilytica TaxID=1703343 RepID=A0A370QF05_9FLAO|nr:hypothetical protein C8D94_102133 [Marinirhabdus gelatinilytica]